MICLSVLSLLLNIYVSKAAVLLWSSKNFNISPLQEFNDADFQRLAAKLHHPQTYVFQNPSAYLSPEMKQVIVNYHSSYNPNGILTRNENTTELMGDPELDITKIKESIDRSNQFLAVIVIPNRSRREVNEEKFVEDASTTTTSSTTSITSPTTPTTTVSASTTTTEPSIPTVFTEPEGPVIYKGQSIKDKLFALMYSSKPLLLKINDTKIYLGQTDPDMITVDTRLNVIIPTANGKVTLRFSFQKISGYYYLTSVKVSDTIANLNVNLTANSNIEMSARFSYHCSGETVFSDLNNTIALYLYDLQVQFDARRAKFSDANDCVSFMTVPIWSGLFVTALLGIVLVIALTAILDIKTMDKFDNQKSQLSITISE